MKVSTLLRRTALGLLGAGVAARVFKAWLEPADPGLWLNAWLGGHVHVIRSVT